MKRRNENKHRKYEVATKQKTMVAMLIHVISTNCTDHKTDKIFHMHTKTHIQQRSLD